MTEESVSAADQAGAPAGDSGSPAADFAELPGDSDVADSVAAESADTLPSEPAQEATLVYSTESAETTESSTAPGDESTEMSSEPLVNSRLNYEGEGVYIGHEPPEGYTIKGNERSKKYHVPESAGYARTTGDVWFSSEEAAERAGFVRAQR
jgi:hypothetical protein